MSSNAYFLGGTDLHDVTLARADERDALSTYPALIDEVRACCGPEVALLFAEPIRGVSRATGQPNVAWYSAHDGTAFSLRQLDAVARGPALEILRQRLQSFAILFTDSRNGAVFASWLHVLSAEGVVLVAGQPVIRNWGMLPNDVASSADARDTHFREGLGQYLPSLPSPPFSAAEAQTFAASMSRHSEREAARAAAPLGATVPPPIEPRSEFRVSRPWLAPAVAAGAAALVLAGLVFGHVLRYPYMAAEPSAAEIEAQRQTNQALRERLARLRSAAGTCRPEGGGTDIPALLPPSPERTKVESTDPTTHQAETSSLGALLEKATVIVMVDHSLGSGFFMSDRYIVTNHHVVGGAREARVASRALGGVVPARVVAVGAGAERGTEDIAVLEIEPKLCFGLQN